MKKLALFVAALVAVPAMFAASAFADSPGQLASGDNLYLVRNVTKDTNYGYSASAACNETVKYSIEVSNTQYGALENVTVKANLGTGALSVSAQNGDNKTVTSTGNVSVTLPSNGTLKYLAGSTKLYKLDGTFVRTLADGIISAGVNKGSLAGSTREFVQFQAKVNCEAPVVKNIKVCEVATGKVVTIKEDAYDSSKHSKDLSDCNEEVKEVASVKELPKTGAGSVMLAGLGLGALVAGGAYALQRRNILG